MITGKLFEYKMSKDFIKTLLTSKDRKIFKGSNQEYLCKFVNDELGLMGTCIAVLSF